MNQKNFRIGYLLWVGIHLVTSQDARTLTDTLGHGFAFFHNSHNLLRKASAYFNDAREPFAITAFGTTFCVITDPRQTTEVYKNTSSLSFEEFIFGLMRYLGLGGETLDAVFHTPLPKDKMGFPNPQGTALGYFVRDMHHHQLFPGENLDLLEKVMVDWFDRHLHLDKMKALCAPYSVSTDKESIEVPLAKWCSELFTRAGEVAYFGDTLHQLEPDMATTFLEYDDLSWQVLYQYPRVFSAKMHAAMDRIQEIFLRYFEIPQEKRTKDAWFTKAIENECRALGISKQDLARFMGMVYWVVSTNTRKAAFWLLFHLMENPSLIPAIRKEIAPAFQEHTIDVKHLHASCPHLENAWFETLRMSANSASARAVREDTIVGGHLIRKGRKIMIPYRFLLHDEAVFGAEVDKFRPGRFEGRSGALTRGPSWRPFGGGKTMCPGHFIAKRETIIFVAMVLNRFDIEMGASPTGFEVDLGKPVLGLADRKDGQDVVMKMTPRHKPHVEASQAS
ncbi:hypothetical protein S40288_06846 [Stachybotrys chartarum IBT 40288]|nr:hypothetical protein S40288_06846 [Stachybotrys chartarum IBT 40288]